MKGEEEEISGVDVLFNSQLQQASLTNYSAEHGNFTTTLSGILMVSFVFVCLLTLLRILRRKGFVFQTSLSKSYSLLAEDEEDEDYKCFDDDTFATGDGMMDQGMLERNSFRMRSFNQSHRNNCNNTSHNSNAIQEQGVISSISPLYTNMEFSSSSENSFCEANLNKKDFDTVVEKETSNDRNLVGACGDNGVKEVCSQKPKILNGYGLSENQVLSSPNDKKGDIYGSSCKINIDVMPKCVVLDIEEEQRNEGNSACVEGDENEVECVSGASDDDALFEQVVNEEGIYFSSDDEGNSIGQRNVDPWTNEIKEAKDDSDDEENNSSYSVDLCDSIVEVYEGSAVLKSVDKDLKNDDKFVRDDGVILQEIIA